MILEQADVNKMSTKYNEHKQWALLQNGEIVKMYWDVEIGYSTKYHEHDADVKYSFIEYRDTFRDADGNILAVTNGIMHGTNDRYIHYTHSSRILAEADTKKELEQYKKDKGIRKNKTPSAKQTDKFIDMLIKNAKDKVNNRKGDENL